jgi:hypothetical protein
MLAPNACCEAAAAANSAKSEGIRTRYPNDNVAAVIKAAAGMMRLMRLTQNEVIEKVPES